MYLEWDNSKVIYPELEKTYSLVSKTWENSEVIYSELKNSYILVYRRWENIQYSYIWRTWENLQFCIHNLRKLTVLYPELEKTYSFVSRTRENVQFCMKRTRESYVSREHVQPKIRDLRSFEVKGPEPNILKEKFRFHDTWPDNSYWHQPLTFTC